MTFPCAGRSDPIGGAKRAKTDKGKRRGLYASTPFHTERRTVTYGGGGGKESKRRRCPRRLMRVIKKFS